MDVKNLGGKNRTYGDKLKNRVKAILEVLHTYVAQEKDEKKVKWQKWQEVEVKITLEPKPETKLDSLKELIQEHIDRLSDKKLKEELSDGSTDKDKITEVLNYYFEDCLKIYEDKRKSKEKAAGIWHFTLKLWNRDQKKNLEQFDKEWDELEKLEFGVDSESTTTDTSQKSASQSSIDEAIRSISCFAYNDGWVGREQLISQLSAKVRGDCRVLILTGITGIGKTALAERLVVELQGNWTEFSRINFDDRGRVTDFASVAAELLTGWQETVTPDDRKNAERLLSRLVRCLREHRYLVLIDSLEGILKGNEENGWSDFEDKCWERFFESLITAESCQSRIVLTSQDLPRQLEAIGSRYPNFWHSQDLSGLTERERLEFFSKKGLDVGTQAPGKPYLERIGTAYEGHPLALGVLAGEIVTKPFYGNVVAYWKRYGHEVEEVERARQPEAEVKSADDHFQLDRYTDRLKTAVKQRVEKTFERLYNEVRNAYLLLCHGSVYRRPVTEDWWLEHLENLGCDTQQQEAALAALRDRYLVEEELIEDEVLLRQHNLIRSVALAHLKNLTTRQQPE